MLTKVDQRDFGTMQYQRKKTQLARRQQKLRNLHDDDEYVNKTRGVDNILRAELIQIDVFFNHLFLDKLMVYHKM